MAPTVIPSAPAVAALALAEEIIVDALALAQSGLNPASDAADRLPAARIVLTAVRHLPDVPPPGTDVGPYFVWNVDGAEWVVNPDVEAAILLAETGDTGPAHELFKLS